MSRSNTAKVRHARRSLMQWREVMARYERGAESQTAFCVREGVALSTFQYWRARLNKQAAPAASAATTPHQALPFVELLTGANGGAFDIELDLGRGVVLRMRSR